MTLPAEAKARGRRIFRAIRDHKRGWRLNWKALGIAYVVEAGIVVSGLAAGVTFANKFAADGVDTIDSIQTAGIGTWTLPIFEGHTEAWKMAVIATIAFCLAEAVRLPLVHAFRTFPSYVWRFVFLLGIIMACGITVKSMSQVAEQMFHPRLRHVQDANAELAVAKADLAKLVTQKTGSSNAMDPQQKVIEGLDKQIEELNKSLQVIGPPPPDKKIVTKVKEWHKNKKGVKWFKWVDRVTYEKVPYEGAAIREQIIRAGAEREKLVAGLGQQQSTVDKFELQVAEQTTVVTEKTNAHLKATADSQLHSFTGMVYGMDPREVTDQQVHAFLRLFVFFPSIFVALASSILAMSAYIPVKRRKAVTENATLTLGEDGTIVKYVDDLVHNEASKTFKAMKLGGQTPAIA